MLAAVLWGCGDEAEDRAEREASRRTASLGSALQVRVEGGALLSHEDTRNGAPARVRVRAQSLDLRLEIEDRGCTPRRVVVEVSHLPAAVEATRRIFLGALSPEVEAAREAAGVAVGFVADPHDPARTPLDAEQPFEAERRDDGRLVWTVSSDRGGGGRVAIAPGESTLEVADAPVACVTFDTEATGPLGNAPLVVRHRLRYVPGAAGFRFALWGNDAGQAGRRAAIVEAIEATEPRPLFAMVNGDLTEDGELDALEAARDQLDASLSIPWFATLGDREADGSAIDDYRSVIGGATYAFDVGDLRLVVLDSADATLAPRTHDRLATWLSAAPLWWGAEPAPPARVVVTHVPPFDPFGGRGRGFKHRPEAARVMAALGRADVAFLVGSQFATWRREAVGGVEVVHSGGGGAPLEGDAPHHWLLVGVGSGCAAPGTRGQPAGGACGLGGARCAGGLFCARSARCTIGVDCDREPGAAGTCRPCVTVERKDL